MFLYEARVLTSVCVGGRDFVLFKLFSVCMCLLVTHCGISANGDRFPLVPLFPIEFLTPTPGIYPNGDEIRGLLCPLFTNVTITFLSKDRLR